MRSQINFNKFIPIQLLKIDPCIFHIVYKNTKRKEIYYGIHLKNPTKQRNQHHNNKKTKHTKEDLF